MKIIHTGDLHIGKIVNEFDMLEDQKHILNEIYNIAVENKVDCIIISGDIYDRSVPKAEAVTLLDSFFEKVVMAGIKILAISGNHDSKERLSFGASILEKGGLIIRGGINEINIPYTLYDEFGPINFYLLPFAKPIYIEKLYDKQGLSNEEAVKECIKNMSVDSRERNIIIAHQFVTNNGKVPETSDSEQDIMIGGIGNVDASVFNDFDYAALGHIHKRCKMGSSNVYYSGSLLKYSFSEVNHNKSVNYIEISEKGNIKVEYLDLKSLRDLREIRGKIKDLISEEVSSLYNREDYIKAILTNEEDLYDPMEELRQVYPNVMQIIIEKNQKDIQNNVSYKNIERKSTLEIFGDFYEMVKGEALSEEKKTIMRDIIEKASEV